MTRPALFEDQHVTAIVMPKGSEGSAGYLRAMLNNLMNGTISVPLRSEDDDFRIKMTAPDDIVKPEGGAGWFADTFTSQGGDQVGQISFTSGTTGTPKGVVLTKAALHDVVARLTDMMDLTSEVREYVGIPVSHSFGYGRARAVLHANGQIYLPPKGFDIGEIRKMLAEGDINALSAVPSLLRVLLTASDSFGAEREALRWIEIGSQMMTADEKIALRELFPAARIVQHYGLTEASRTTFLQIDGTPKSKLGSVGPATGVTIGDNQTISVTGSHVAKALLTEDGPIPMDGKLTTSDLGRIDADGFLWFEGRVDDMINCGGIKLNPDAIETAIKEDVAQTGDFAVFRTPDAIRGETLALALAPSSAPYAVALQTAALRAANMMGAAPGHEIKFTTVSALPKTNTGKLQRHLLALPQSGLEEESPLGALGTLMGADIAPETSFLDSGRDSLTHLQVQLLLEATLGTAPMGWETKPVSELAAALANADPDQGQKGAPPLPDGRTNCNPKDIGFWELVAEDFRTNDGTLGSQGFWALFVNRFGNWRMGIRSRFLRVPFSLLYRLLRKLAQIFCGIKLDYTVAVGRRVKLEHFGGMMLGARSIGDDTIIRQNTTFGIRSTSDLNAKPTIGCGVDIGAGAVIVGNVKIGDRAVVGANAVVYFSVPANAIVQGVPAKIVGQNQMIQPDALSRSATTSQDLKS